jgi:hypothetical protein
MNIRFGGVDGSTPQPPKNEPILPHLAKLVHPDQAVTEELTLAFADAWVKDSAGAITTLGDVFKSATQLLKEELPTTRKGQPKRREGAAFVEGRLNRYLSFFRREFWDAKFPGKLLREFAPIANRSDDSLKNAMTIGLPPRKGAWLEAINFIRAEAPQEFYRTLQKFMPGQTAAQALPTPEPPKQSHRRWEEEGDNDPPFTSWHINDYPPDKRDDDFID